MLDHARLRPFSYVIELDTAVISWYETLYIDETL